MAKYRIKAYFMHESEQAACTTAAAKSLISEAEWTDGYVMGIVDKSTISKLRRKGLVVSLVEEVAEPGDPLAPSTDTVAPGPQLEALSFSVMSSAPRGGGGASNRRPLPKAIAEKTPAKKILSQDKRRVQFYVVRFHGPITSSRRKELKEIDVKLLERLSRNKYTVKLKPSQVKLLATLSSVDTIRVYTEGDTLRTGVPGELTLASAPTAPAVAMTIVAASDKPASQRRTSIYSVRLHQSKDMAAVVKWLKSRKRKPIWKHGDQVQVALPDDSKLVADLAKRTEVAVVEKFAPPRLFDEPARIILGLVRKRTSIGLQGNDEIIGVADTGIDATHKDLKNRIAGVSAWGRPNDTSDPEGHGTHVAGCIVGDGTASNGEVLGAAPKAKVFFQSILDANGRLGGLPPDVGDLLKEAYQKGARIHNNSWGAFTFARYSNTSLDFDRFVAANPDMLVVIAAGNDGIGTPRVPGASMSATKGFVDWPCVAAPATAKNGLTVGASRNSRIKGGYAELTWGEVWQDRYPHNPISQEMISGKEDCLAAFSSRGPCDDLRIKPDVVAPGTDIAAARSKDAPLHKFWGAYANNNQYGFMGGTSMAAPYVAGCAALVREWYRTTGGWKTPSAALLKATLINGTQRMNGADATAPLPGDPNYHQGFGRIDMSNTVPSPLAPGLQLVFADTWKSKTFTTTGQRLIYQLEVGEKLPLRVCLVWTDPPARGLQNSLVLMLDRGGSEKRVGNTGAATLLTVSGNERDPNNNVQVIRIAKPTAGTYTIAIFSGTILVPPQSFAIVATGDLKSPLNHISGP